MSNIISHTIYTDKGMNNKDGAYFCSNMRKDPKGGMMADYKLSQWAVKTSGETTEWMNYTTKFVQRKYNNEISVFLKSNNNGDIHILAELGAKVWKAMDYTNGLYASKSRGMAVDSKNEVVYTGDRYLGRTATSKLDGNLAQGANTCDVDDAGEAPASGYAFIKDGVVNGETIQYTGKTANQLTGVTRGKYNSTDAAHGDDCEIIFFDDDWKDLGARETEDLRPVIRVEDYILVGNVNKVAGYKETDGSDWSTNMLDLPAECEIIDFSTILTGSGIRVLIATNFGNYGKIFVWEVGESSWERVIELNENIYKLHKNFVACKSGMYQTNGYELTLIAALPDDEKEIRSADFDVYDIASKENMLLVTSNGGVKDRNRNGLWVLDLTDKSWYYILPSNYGTYDQTFAAIFISSNWRLFVSHNYNEGCVDLLTTSARERGNYIQFIYDPKTAKTLQLQKLKLNIDTKLKEHYQDKNIKFDAIIRYYDFTAPFFQYSNLNAAAGVANEILISKSLGVPKVGDRVEIVQRDYTTRVDVAGAPRNITAIATGASSYTLTLDDDLPATIDATTGSAGLLVLINPLKKISKISIDRNSIDLRDLSIIVKDQPKFKKMMLEVEFRVSNGHPAPRLNSVEPTSLITNL